MRVLVVEDEPKMARILRRGLEDEGYAIDTAPDGIDGLHMATENDYDAVILDVMLPGHDGFEVCRKMRSRSRWAPVLMLTARDGVTDRVQGLDAGADDYLSKPFSFEELLARVRALVRRGAVERPPVLRVGDLTMDPATRRVERAGKAVSLTPKEYALLEYFMRNPGVVLSRTRILDHVWDYNYDGASNVVDVYVKYLRRKIDTDGEPSLKTVRGAGYLLDPGTST
ncbi:MAG: response regulator transcription factor [Actinobacteria bacterium]|nr:MAG: response regulator transcription factor [Actinomycetota bacterium]